MKKISIFITLLSIALSFNLSAQYDLAALHVTVNDPLPNNGNEFDTDQTIKTISFTVKNVGGVAVSTGTLVPVDFIVDGKPLRLTYRLYNILNPGDSINYPATSSSSFSLPDFPSTPGNFDVCCEVLVVGDTNSSNNKSCTTYNMIPGTVPKVHSFAPGNGPCLTVITITGENFNPSISKNIVKIRHVDCKVLTATSTELTVEVPEGGYSGRISVIVNVDGDDKTGESSGLFTNDGCALPVDEISNLPYSIYYSNEIVNISLGTGVISDGPKKIQIVNISGQVVLSKSLAFEGGKEEISVSRLSSGTYIVNIEGNTSKFVK